MQSPERAETIEAPPPPSYAESSGPSMPLVIQMSHHEPGKLLDTNLVRAGALIKEQGDIIMFDDATISYVGTLKLLHRRIQARSGITAPSKAERFLCRLVLIRKHQLILLEKGSWPAARAMLKTHPEATLLFMFAIVARSFSGPTMMQRLKSVWSDVDYKICLVEPEFPMHDEVVRMARYEDLI